MIESLLIYFSCSLIPVIIVHFCSKNCNRKLTNLGISLAFLIPLLVSGFRFSIGTDYYSYINGFELIKSGLNVRWANLEIGYLILNKILIFFNLPPQSIMFMTSFLMLFFLFKALLKKKSIIPIEYGLLAFLLLFFQSSFNVIRLMLAVSIFFYNISNIENKKIYKYILYSLLATSIHFSALITIPLYWIFNFFKFDNKLFKRILLYILIIFVFTNFNKVLFSIISNLNFLNLNYYNNYIGNSNDSVRLAIIKTILWVPILIPGVVFYDKCIICEKNFRLYFSLFFIGILINALSTFNLTYIDRIANYFLICAVMIIPVYIKVFMKLKPIVSLILFFSINVYLYIYWYYIYFIKNFHGTVPYQVFF